MMTRSRKKIKTNLMILARLKKIYIINQFNTKFSSSKHVLKLRNKFRSTNSVLLSITVLLQMCRLKIIPTVFFEIMSESWNM